MPFSWHNTISTHLFADYKLHLTNRSDHKTLHQSSSIQLCCPVLPLLFIFCRNKCFFATMCSPNLATFIQHWTIDTEIFSILLFPLGANFCCLKRFIFLLEITICWSCSYDINLGLTYCDLSELNPESWRVTIAALFAAI